MIRQETAWLIRKPTINPAIRLFCLPYAGGGTSIYHLWSSQLPATIEINAIQLPGREFHDKLVAYDNMATLLPPLAQAIAPFLQPPFAIFGHSLGGLIAYELVHYLQQNDYPQAEHLLISACQAPHLPIAPFQAHMMNDEALLSYLVDEYDIPEQVLFHPQLMTSFLPTLRADFKLYATYQYHQKELLNIPITAFCGQSDEGVPCKLMQAWVEQTMSSFQLYEVPGTHFFIRTHRDTLLKQLQQVLDYF